MSQMFQIGYDHCCMLRHIWKYNWNARWYIIYVTNVSHRLWSLHVTSHVHVSFTSYHHTSITSYALLRLYICSFASIATTGCIICRCVGLFFGQTGLFRSFVGLFCVTRDHRMYHLQMYRALFWTHRALSRLHWALLRRLSSQDVSSAYIQGSFKDTQGSFAYIGCFCGYKELLWTWTCVGFFCRYLRLFCG